MAEDEDGGPFSVVIWFPNDTYEYVGRDLDAKAAVEMAKDYTERPAARHGFIMKIAITDSGDYTNFQWEFGKGIVYPTPEQRDS
jgi:hypothetical protein